MKLLYHVNSFKTTFESQHSGKEKKKCNICKFESHRKSAITEHIERVHQGKMVSCKDCSFQGLNRIELRNHIRANKHNPNQTIEVCYICEKEFDSYWSLMNHRRAEHPSNKICRYFK